MGENWILLNVFGLYHESGYYISECRQTEFKYAKLMAIYLVNIQQFVHLT